MKLTQQLILTCALLAALSACTSNSNSANPAKQPTPAPSSNQPEGGITSGGGGTLPAERPSPNELSNYIQNAKTQLGYYFKMLEQIHRSESTPLYADRKEYFKILFDGEATIYDILETKVPEILYDKPCLDYANNEVDGSARASTRGQYCISVFRIIPKVSKSEAFVEVTALVGHELSHFLGTSEETANEIQKDIAKKFRESFVNENTLDTFVNKGVQTFTAPQRLAELFLKHLEHSEYDNDQEMFNDIYNQDRYTIGHFSDYESPTDHIYKDKSFVLLSEIEKQQNYYIQDQAQALRYYACSNQTVYLPTQEHCQKELDKVFKGRDFVEWQELNPKASPEWKNRRIYRIKNLADAKEILTGIVAYYGVTSFLMWPYYANYMHPRYFSYPFWSEKEIHPWEKHVGRYKVVQQNCSTDQMPLVSVPNLSSIEIVRSESLPTMLLLKETSNNSVKETYLPLLNPLFYQAHQSELTRQGATLVYNQNGKATRLIDLDDSTGETEFDRVVQTDQIVEKSTGLQLKRTKFVADNKYLDFINGRYFECTYNLERQ